MTSDREFHASTVEEAVAKAAEELGVGADELGFKVLDEGNTGFLGIGARDARIAVQAQDAPLYGALEEGPVVPSTASSTGAEVGAGVGTPSADAVERSTSSDLSELGEEPVAGDVTDAPGELIDEVRVMVTAFLAAMDFEAGLDAEGYRQRGVEALQGMAHRTARRAIREQRAVELPPMSSSERRVVHLFLQDNPRVTTHSEGNGDSRRVKVSPVS